PVAVTTSSTVKTPISSEPPISVQERNRIQSEIQAENARNETVNKVLEPQATTAERQQVVDEIKAIAPAGTEIVDPYDGKIKLTAIQTSLSVAESEGKEVSKTFSYPKQLADSVSPDADEVKRNKDKNVVRTDTDVVVVAPKGKRSTYTVQSGDTLAIIAMKNGVSWRDIAQWNQIDPNAPLYVGTPLYLYDAKPQNATNATTTNKTKPETYVVKANDSLTSVATQYGVTVKQLADWNNLPATGNLFVGQKLNLIAPAEVKTPTSSTSQNRGQTATVNKSSKIKTKTYVVKRGEYLKLIADRYALSNQELADLTSGLTASSNLMVGQKINVPLHEANETVTSTDIDAPKTSEKIKTENYTVQRGDTLSSIAAKSKISVADLIKLNNLSASNALRYGQTLKIPQGVTVTTPETYVVKSGDSLSSIASQYNVPLDTLSTLNGLTRNSGVRVGQRLKLTGDIAETASVERSAATDTSSYVVKRGDTLASVAKKYNLKLTTLAEINGLSSNSRLTSGQNLKLVETERPNKTSKADAVASSKSSYSGETESYVVQAGESLNALASRFGIATKTLADLNDLTTKASLRRGQSLKVPKQTTTYKVKSGDSLIRLASKYNIDVKQLAEMNGIEPNTQLRLGTTLKVPNL
ncbi:MAG: LysM peptidoglycan-binding domain-containing protein, partial [Acinetobacter sp.]